MRHSTQHNTPLRILVIGASFGLLPAAKIAAAGHEVTVVGRAKEVCAIAKDGVAIHFSEHHVLRPPMGLNGLSLATPDRVDPGEFDLVFLAVQEPQVQASELQNLVMRIADQVPVASIMNMPPPPFLKRIPSVFNMISESAYENPSVWQALPPERMTLASPDPQAFRPDPARPGQLRVTLSSNFKFAPFARSADQKILTRVTRDASRLRQEWGQVPVHFLARKSVFTPLAKWPMLVTGNCRCVGIENGPVSIREAVNRDLNRSRQLYNAVNNCLLAIGAPKAALVPFESYAKATKSLTRPSSLSLALEAGATAVERIDILVLNLLQNTSRDSGAIELMSLISAHIDQHLARNRMTGASRPSLRMRH